MRHLKVMLLLCLLCVGFCDAEEHDSTKESPKQLSKEVDKSGAAPGAHTSTVQASGGAIKVGTRIVKPFVFEANENLTGFSVDLWNSIALHLNLTTEYDVHDTLDALLEGVKDGEDVAAISAVSITAKREEIFDFSLPMFDSGLSIMVPVQKETGFISFLSGIKLGDLLEFLIIFLLLIGIPAHVVWFAERKNEEDDFISSSYFPGIFQAAFWSASTLGGQAEGFPKHTISRFVSIVWIYVSIIFVAYFTAFMTTQLTVQQLKGGISSPNDLRGKYVATIKDSTAALFLKANRTNVLDFDTIDEAIQAVNAGKAIAVVYDSPVLLYYVSHENQGNMEIVGDTFHKENYGIIFPIGSELRIPVNRALLSLKESGVYQQLYDRWFGKLEGQK